MAGDGTQSVEGLGAAFAHFENGPEDSNRPLTVLLNGASTGKQLSD